MNVLKYLDSKGIKDNPRIIDSGGQATDFYLQDLLEDYTKQLTLTDVSQQSELLFCKCGSVKNRGYGCMRTDCDNTLQAFMQNNCG